jgi:hypothetical protein
MKRQQLQPKTFSSTGPRSNITHGNFKGWPRGHDEAGKTKGGSITVPLTSSLTGLESAVWQLTIFVFICKADFYKPVKQGVNGTVILPPFSIPWMKTLKQGCCTIQEPGNTNWRGMFNTVNFLIKATCLVKKVNNIFYIKRSWSKLVSTRRWTVPSLPLQ